MLVSAVNASVPASSSSIAPVIYFAFAMFVALFTGFVLWDVNARRKLKKTDPIVGYVVGLRYFCHVPDLDMSGDSSSVDVSYQVEIAIEYSDPVTGDLLISQQSTTTGKAKKYLSTEALNNPVYVHETSTPYDITQGVSYIAGATGHARHLHDQGISGEEISQRFMNDREASLTGFTMIQNPVQVKVWVGTSKRCAHYVVFEWID